MENNEIKADEVKYADPQTKAQVTIMTCKRVFNLGNYNTRHLEMVSNVEPGADVDAVAEDLVHTVEKAVMLEIAKAKSDSEPKPKSQPVAASTENFDDKPW